MSRPKRADEMQRTVSFFFMALIKAFCRQISKSFLKVFGFYFPVFLKLRYNTSPYDTLKMLFFVKELTMDKQQILEFINQNPVFSLGTIDEGKPRVRYMMTSIADERGIIFCTGRKKDVYKQIS